MSEPQQRQTALGAKTPGAAALLSGAVVGPGVAARYRDAPPGPPSLQPKDLAAEPLLILLEALKRMDTTP